MEIWTGYATDPEIRYRASSGGLLSALALYCLERENMSFVLHTGSDEQEPWLNRTVQSRTRAEILARAGSRYAPSSPCDSLRSIEKSDRPCVFVGKPCDAVAVAMLRKRHPPLDHKLGLVLTFFCAGVPSTRGTLQVLKSCGVNRAQVTAIRYRGNGWPGSFTALSGSKCLASMSYEESWGQLTGFRPLRCKLCPDGLGRLGDISCGDAWDQFEGDGKSRGASILVVRTARGAEILRRAVAAGYLELSPARAQDVYAAQPSLLEKRRELFGRLLAMRMLLIPTPLFRGFFLFSSWWKLPLFHKFRTVAGTMRRAISRNWWRPDHLCTTPHNPAPTTS